MNTIYRNQKTERKKEQILVSLKDCFGIVAPACKRSRMSRTQFYAWVNNDPLFAQKVQEINQIVADFAESKLMERMVLGDREAAIAVLRAKAPERGY